MSDEQKREGLFEDDDLDDAVAGADDTGMVRQQQIIAEEEIAQGEDPGEEEPDFP